jgi:phosphoglycolate phosphatase-like HAD superfamily hydrolase
MKKLSSVIFDLDGVLLDSLTPHLRLCEDKNQEYGLGLKIPSASDFKVMVSQGVRISPMNYFFQAVGFPREYADQAFAQYKETFMQHYPPRPFPGIGEVLSKLKAAGLKLGIVTSNVRSNVDSALGPNMKFFHPECIFTNDDPVGNSKVDALRSAAKKLHVEISEIVYVGDQPADWKAANEAGANFLGVTYGWGICEDEREFPVVNSVIDITENILNNPVWSCKGTL